ncbi:hypothetical protein F4556_003196 [Kitasatospora gansuensis]|uniref:Uncharacterized protein n=1 Tax=Kitasatospora gansuensis TaxID=258050 RepID=A0A7W7SBX9_9ACTN|nr:hypothetical protein [Kitasatospora gansuensis]
MGLGADDLRVLAPLEAAHLRNDRAVILGTEHDGKALLIAAITPRIVSDGAETSKILPLPPAP